MNLEVVAAKLDILVKKVRAEKGPLGLLGLFLREDSPDLWDLVISAPWLGADERSAFGYVANELRQVLSDEELIGLSRIVILEYGGAVLGSFLTQYANRTGPVDMHFETGGGVIIRRAYIIVAQSGSHHPRPNTTIDLPQGKTALPNRVPLPKRSARNRPAVS